MRITLIELLLFLVPTSCLCLWLSDRNELKQIEWQEFSMSKLDACRNVGMPAIVFCRPEIFLDLPIPNGFQESSILRNYNAGEFAAFEHNYEYWAKSREKWPEETKWIVGKGAGKEANLILVSQSGETKKVWYANTDMVTDFLKLTPRVNYKSHLLFAMFVCTATITAAIILRGRKTNKDPIAR